MQAQSRLSVNGGSGLDPAPTDERDAVVRELTLGHELTARLQEEVLRSLRGQGQAEATAAFILREVSRAFTVCLSIMGGPAPAAPRTDSTVPVGARRAGEDSVPRKTTVTPSPDSDGHQWRKYGQKRIMNTSFPRCYYRCSYHRERSCPAMKQVQKHSNGDPPLYLVIYVHEHTCHHTTSSLPRELEVAGTATDPLDFSMPLRRQQDAGSAHADRGAKEELALVSSLACVLRGQPFSGTGGASPEGIWQGRAGDGASTSTASVDAPSEELPMLDADEGFGGLDIMDYDVTDTMYLTHRTDGLRDHGPPPF